MIKMIYHGTWLAKLFSNNLIYISLKRNHCTQYAKVITDLFMGKRK